MSASVSSPTTGSSTGGSTGAPKSASKVESNAGNKVAANGFDKFEFHPSIERGIRAMGFTNPRPIQAETIEASLDGQDVLGLAQTGTGKTAAFALPILDLLLDEPGRGPRALVLAPTRELANQIGAEIRSLSKFTKLKMVTIYGGMPMRGQINALKNGPEIVVGCPGRVLDLIGQGHLKLGKCETLVLDEADHMFDMGFLPDIRRILKSLPEDRQNLLFSATMPKEIRKLADDVLYEPHVVELADHAPAATIDHALYPVIEKDKRDLLNHLLAGEDCNSAIVFTRTKHRARRLADQLGKGGHRAIALQGNMSQAARDKAMSGFRNRQYDILVATDIAARGIDVSGISHVINYDVPNTPEAYTHRIGRTGRSELEGIACTFVTGDDRGWLRATERMIGEPIARKQVAGFECDLENLPEGKKPSGGGGGGRGRGGARGNGGGGGGSRGRGRGGSSRGRSSRGRR